LFSSEQKEKKKITGRAFFNLSMEEEKWFSLNSAFDEK